MIKQIQMQWIVVRDNKFQILYMTFSSHYFIQHPVIVGDLIAVSPDEAKKLIEQ